MLTYNTTNQLPEKVY